MDNFQFFKGGMKMKRKTLLSRSKLLCAARLAGQFIIGYAVSIAIAALIAIMFSGRVVATEIIIWSIVMMVSCGIPLTILALLENADSIWLAGYEVSEFRFIVTAVCTVLVLGILMGSGVVGVFGDQSKASVVSEASGMLTSVIYAAIYSTKVWNRRYNRESVTSICMKKLFSFSKGGAVGKN